jgi:hypothetical protein
MDANHSAIIPAPDYTIASSVFDHDREDKLIYPRVDIQRLQYIHSSINMESLNRFDKTSGGLP